MAVVTGWQRVERDAEFEFEGGAMAIVGNNISANNDYVLQTLVGGGNNWRNITRGSTPTDIDDNNRMRIFNHLPAGTYRIHRRTGSETDEHLYYAYCPQTLQDAALY